MWLAKVGGSGPAPPTSDQLHNGSQLIFAFSPTQNKCVADLPAGRFDFCRVSTKEQEKVGERPIKSCSQKMIIQYLMIL
ncbi:unnamed protein product [Nezara viridula]|uniref:Uncharacterized protein n=1 Tax=Nezara viridula TaxID=85310 RepID=A0A9P0HIM9_NEZVI|nr:unnamed protein product [Nezara viridula]